MRLLAPALFTAMCWAPSVWACSVCGQGTEENQWAYIAMTAMLSALPLAMLGFGLAWMVRRMYRAEQAAGSKDRSEGAG